MCGLYMSLSCLSLCLCKQMTAYEMRISDWSSDVCSSDLGAFWRSRSRFPGHRVAPVTVSSAVRGGLSFLDSVAAALGARRILCGRLCAHHHVLGQGLSGDPEIGRASCRERVCQYVKISVGAETLKQKTTINKQTK